MALKLHLGCGNRRLEGWVNIDSRAEVGPDMVMDATNLQYPDGSVDEIYACHVLEHIETPAKALVEWHRVLKYHGLLMLAVPDIGNIAKALVAGVHLARVRGLIWGGHKYTGDLHYNGWDFESLAVVLRSFKFYDISKWSPYHELPEGYHDFSYAVLYGDDNQNWSMSLNVAARKI